MAVKLPPDVTEKDYERAVKFEKLGYLKNEILTETNDPPELEDAGGQDGRRVSGTNPIDRGLGGDRVVDKE